ncbi:hypothetical protein ACLQ3K_22120 [Tsukamurella sp. DT100]|uniref:hypothetical protein n=1 Tax=Tsukamurella sp. DT100 TaxID=3393415 RepID=UPI003CE8DF61
MIETRTFVVMAPPSALADVEAHVRAGIPDGGPIRLIIVEPWADAGEETIQVDVDVDVDRADLDLVVAALMDKVKPLGFPVYTEAEYDALPEPSAA